MFSSFSAKHLTTGDQIKVQTLTGAHEGTVARPAEQTPDVVYTVAVSLDCTSCASRHSLDLPGYRLISAVRTP